MHLIALVLALFLASPVAAQQIEDKEVTLKLSEIQAIIASEVARARAASAYSSLQKQVQPPAPNLEPPPPPKVEPHPIPEEPPKQ
ncbi:MAG: hypothetical protein JO051_03435 [Acidobacteriaceae bacterium]|nr:hypothetical protein [Acidobacteriaceae bacterium]